MVKAAFSAELAREALTALLPMNRLGTEQVTVVTMLCVESSGRK